MPVTIRLATTADHNAIWLILEPMIRAGETYTLPRDLSRDAALAYWLAPEHEVFVALASNDADSAEILGTYFLQPNKRGAGSHVANCGYVTAPNATGKGIASAMCEHSLARARERNFRAMQFNFVVASNQRAVRLWLKHGFRIVGTIPNAFLHPTHGPTHAHVMFREL
jgi:ribosomal protein S18 acetylase RimI-like enzyme